MKQVFLFRYILEFLEVNLKLKLYNTHQIKTKIHIVKSRTIDPGTIKKMNFLVQNHVINHIFFDKFLRIHSLALN